MPKRQSEFGFEEHEPPAVHGLHTPPLQTPPEQPVPLPFGVESSQTGAPDAQLTTPFLHAEFGLVVQLAP